MEYDKNICPIVDIDGLMEGGKQFDLDITIPCDNREVIYGIVRDCFKEPVCNAVVKLVEVVCEHGEDERRPVSHTFTDKEGEFVFGPLCPNKVYEIQIWVSKVKHVKICAKCDIEGKCLKGEDIDCSDHCRPKKEHHKEEYKYDYKEEYKKEYKDDYKNDYKKECKDDYKDEHKEYDYKDDCKKEHKNDYKDDYKKEHEKCDCKEKDYKDEHKDDCKKDHKEYDCKEKDYKDEHKDDCKKEHEKCDCKEKDYKDDYKDDYKKDNKECDCKKDYYRPEKYF